MPDFYDYHARELEYRAVRGIIDHWGVEFCSRFGGKLPRNYCTFDLETTGFSREKDLIVEWGHCLVEDCIPVNRMNLVINWLGSGLVPDEYILAALTKVESSMRAKGKPWRVTAAVMREEGLPPDEALNFIFDFLSQLFERDEMFVAHNGWNFDAQMLESHSRDFLGEAFRFADNRLFDTGATEKASQIMHQPYSRPVRGDTLRSYFERITKAREPGIFWSLDRHCVAKYGLDKKFDVDPAALHVAGSDAFVLHLLFEEFRRIAESKDHELSALSATPAVAVAAADAALPRRRGQRNR